MSFPRRRARQREFVSIPVYFYKILIIRLSNVHDNAVPELVERPEQLIVVFINHGRPRLEGRNDGAGLEPAADPPTPVGMTMVW